MRRSSKTHRPTGKMDFEVFVLTLLGYCEMVMGLLIFSLNITVLYMLPYSRFIAFHSSCFLMAGLQFLSGLTAVIAVTSTSTAEDSKKILPWHLQGSVTALSFFAFLLSVLFFSSSLSLPDVILKLTHKEVKFSLLHESTLKTVYYALYTLFYLSAATAAISAGLAWYLLQNLTDLYRLPRPASVSGRTGHRPSVRYPSRGSTSGHQIKAPRGALFMRLQ